MLGPNPPRADVQKSDAQAILQSIRFYLHCWPVIVGVAALIPNQFPSTEKSLIIAQGLPDWLLGVVLLVSGTLLVVSQIIVVPYQRWTLAIGDFIVGTECFIVAAMMGLAAAHHHGSWLSVGLWLLPALMFELLCVQRARGG